MRALSRASSTSSSSHGELILKLGKRCLNCDSWSFFIAGSYHAHMGAAQPKPTRAFLDFQKTVKWKNAPRGAHCEQLLEVDPLAFHIRKSVFAIFGNPNLEKCPATSALRSTKIIVIFLSDPLQWTVRLSAALWFLDVPKLKRWSRRAQFDRPDVDLPIYLLWKSENRGIINLCCLGGRLGGMT